jgi:hypothetical protein
VTLSRKNYYKIVMSLPAPGFTYERESLRRCRATSLSEQANAMSCAEKSARYNHFLQ